MSILAQIGRDARSLTPLDPDSPVCRVRFADGSSMELVADPGGVASRMAA